MIVNKTYYSIHWIVIYLVESVIHPLKKQQFVTVFRHCYDDKEICWPTPTPYPVIVKQSCKTYHATFDLQLEKLLEDVRKVTLEGKEESVSSKCALFVCNKWDQVPENEVKEVQNHVIKKLKKCWPGLVPESQIINMSTKNASTAQNHGIITEEFFSLMSGMRFMVLKSIEAKLEMHWR